MNIQIFIATYNRAHFLKQSIESFLNQTIPPDEIIILDNNSTDNTEQVVAQYPKCRYVKTHGFLGNFNKARELVNKDYLMIFHDDDVLNPYYLEFALGLIKKHNPSMITTRYTKFTDKPIINNINKKYYLFDTQKELARYMIGVEGVSYCSAIYDTKAFLSEELEYSKYGKFNDWSFMCKMGAHGKTIITRDENMNYTRIHPGQDTRNIKTSVTGEQIINWDKFFYNILKNDILTSKSYHFLKSKYDLFTTPQFKRLNSFASIRDKFLKECPLVNRNYDKQLLELMAINIAEDNLYDYSL
jgi:glycosyltransferase involved in cell wall biosynthesis